MEWQKGYYYSIGGEQESRQESFGGMMKAILVAVLGIFAVLVFAGIQLISLGMIGEYVGRIFLSQNKKPQYTIRKSLKRDG